MVEAGYEERFRLRGFKVASLSGRLEPRVERNLGRDMKVAERSNSVANGADARKSFIRGFCGLALSRFLRAGFIVLYEHFQDVCKGPATTKRDLRL